MYICTKFGEIHKVPIIKSICRYTNVFLFNFFILSTFTKYAITACANGIVNTCQVNN